MKKNKPFGELFYRSLKKTLLIMRIAIILRILGILQARANDAYSQKTRLSLNFSETELVKVLDKIEDESEFFFLYNEKLLDTERKVNVTANDQLISVILDDLFSGTDVKYTIIDRKIILAPEYLTKETDAATIMQQKVVSGTVTDASNGEGMAGVNIQVKGTTIGTISDVKGKYSIPSAVDQNAILVFSFIGYVKQEVAVAGKTVIDVALAGEMTSLEEVMVVGYGTMQKSDLTGSVVRADIKSFEESPSVSIMQSLQGNVPGLNVGQVDQSGENPEFSIRGRTTISGSQKPLIVLDGVIYRGNLVDINTYDVESVNVLKDASSTAIYGSEAANGVILIKTKSGEGYLGKPKISYSGQITYNTPSKILEPIRREGALQKAYDADWTNSSLAPEYLESNPDWNRYNTFNNIQQANGYDNGVDSDWLKLLTQNAYIRQHNIGITGGTDIINYNTSFGYTDQKGWLINDDYKRYNIRVNLDSKITDWFSVSIQSFISSSDYSGASPDPSDIYTHPLYQVYDEKGIPIPEPTGSGINPVLKPNIDDFDKNLNIFGNVNAKIDIPFVKGLSYNLTYNNTYLHGRKYYFDKYSNNFLGYGYKNYDINYSWAFDNILEYKRTFNKHKINATLVYGREKRKSEFTHSESSDFDNPVLVYNSLQAGKIQIINSGGWEENSIYSMGRMFYSFKDKYMFTGTIRRDGFSGFGEENKFGVFPSVALAWVTSKESFLQGIKWLNNLKMRVSYGINGNRTIDRYATLAKVQQNIAYIYGDGGTATIGQWISNLPNPELKWESTTGINFGVDFGVFNNRLFGNIEYYDAKTNDLLYDINIPVLTGFSSIPTNIGELHNHGFEMTLTSVNFRKSDWNWQTTFNLSLNRNEVISILGRDDNGDGKEDDIVSSEIFIGEPLGVLYDYEIAGMYQIGDEIPSSFYPGTYKLKDLNNDGIITPEFDRKIVGNTDPGYLLSFQSNLKFKKWTFNIFINSIQGGNDYYYANGSPQGIFSKDNEKQWSEGSTTWDYWTPENPDAKHPQIQSLAIYRVNLPVQRNFVRLQNISLSYDFNTKSDLNTNFEFKGKIYVNGKNIHTWTNWEGWDPETGSGLAPDGRPVMKSYTVGLEIEF